MTLRRNAHEARVMPFNSMDKQLDFVGVGDTRIFDRPSLLIDGRQLSRSAALLIIRLMAPLPSCAYAGRNRVPTAPSPDPPEKTSETNKQLRPSQ